MTPEHEEWRDIPGYEGYYQASNQGRIRGLDRTVMRSNGVSQYWRGRILRPGRLASGHLHVSLRTPTQKPRTLRVHQLVMWAFVGPTPPGMEVCHNNGTHEDNRLENLRFDTHANNMADIPRHGGTIFSRRTHCVHGHEYTPENTGWNKSRSGRYCRQCKSDRWKQWDARQDPVKRRERQREYNREWQKAKRRRLREAQGSVS